MVNVAIWPPPADQCSRLSQFPVAPLSRHSITKPQEGGPLMTRHFTVSQSSPASAPKRASRTPWATTVSPGHVGVARSSFDAAPAPRRFTARTRKTYSTPFSRPVTQCPVV